MKLNFKLLSTAVLTAFSVSCTELIPTELMEISVPDGYRIETLDVSMGETRAAIDGTTGALSWANGDRLSFHLSDGSYYEAPVDPATGKVTVLLKEGVTRDNFAVFPAASAVTEHYREGDLTVRYPNTYGSPENPYDGNAAMPMLATNDPTTSRVSFQHVGGLIRADIEVPESTKTVVVSLGKRVTGEFDVVRDGTGNLATYPTSFTNGKEITYVVSEEGTSEATQVQLYVPVPVGTYNTLEVTSYNDMIETGNWKSWDVPFTIERASGKKVSVTARQMTAAAPAVRPVNPLRFTSEGETSISMSKSGNLDIWYSRTGGNNSSEWTAWNGQEIVHRDGGTIYVCGENDSISQSNSYSSFHFSGTGKITVAGDILTLLSPDGNAQMGPYAFKELFYGAENLVSAADLLLPSENLAMGCYNLMFDRCENLTEAPALPATTLAEGCYQSMFYGCSSLEHAPELPATELAPFCYAYMFDGCTFLRESPALPAMSVPDGAYLYMFSGCWTSFETAPALPATEIGESAYEGMFASCSMLAEAPALPATVLAKDCYRTMFFGTGITECPVLPAMIMAEGCYAEMFMYCDGLTAPPALPATQLAEDCYNSMFYGCRNLVSAPALPANETAPYCYHAMFWDCKSLKVAPSLPATELAEGCYSGMLEGTGVTTAPLLPATAMKTGCYRRMFARCKDLLEPPVLASTNLAAGCYAEMFIGAGLKRAPELPAENLAYECYSQMFSLCENLIEAMEILPASTLKEWCYSSMFNCCKNLVKAPELPAETLMPNCYFLMFNGCEKLNWVKAMCLTKPSASYTENWLKGVSPSGTFIKNEAATWATTRSATCIPEGWDVYTETNIEASF